VAYRPVMQQSDYKNGTFLFSMWSVLKCYNWEVWSLVQFSSVDSSVQKSVKRGLEPGAEE
jgi:hypothetical protein